MDSLTKVATGRGRGGEPRLPRMNALLMILSLVFLLLFGLLPARASAGTAEEINALPILDSFNRTEVPLSNGGKWSPVAWASSTLGASTGRAATGWGPYDAWPTINGAYWTPTTFAASPGSAAAVTMQTGPGNPERHVALWLDMGNPASARSGYQLRWVNTSGNTYSVILAKWSSGTESVLASNASVAIPAGSTLAISDTGGTVQAWQGTGGSLTSFLSASDSTYANGYAGIEGSGNISRSTNFKAGILIPPPDTTIASGPKGNVVPNVLFSFNGSGGATSFECSLDGGTYAACTSPNSYSGLSEGTHTFRVRAVSASGPDPSPAERSFQVLEAAKAVAKVAILDNFERSEVPLATGKWTKNQWVAEIGGAWMGGYRGYGSSGGLAGAYWNQGTFSDGEGTVLVSGVVGTGATPSGQYLALWLNMPGPGTVRSGYEARFTGNGSTYTVELSKWVAGTRTVLASTANFALPVGTTMALSETAGGRITLWTGTTTLSALLSANDSTYSSGYGGLDVNGGAGTVYNFRAGRIDLQAPDTSITSGPSGAVLPSEVSFSFSSTETGSSFECLLDGGSYAACTSPKAYFGLAGGPHTFKVRATDNVGNQDGTPAERSFEVIPPPVVSTGAATTVKATQATLGASVNPKGSATTYQFEYGTTTAYGSKAPAVAKSAGSGIASVEVSEPISGLTAGTTYHFRIVATNGAGTAKGEDKTFTTVAAPAATTESATNVRAGEATLNASINPKGAATTYQFEYGPTTSYGSKVPASAKAVGSGSSAVAVSETPFGLTEGATYHYRVVAINEVGTTYGADKTIETPFLPEATTEPPTAIEGQEATLEGTVDPNGSATEYVFEYGTTAGYGTTIAPDGAGDGTSAIEATESIGNLQPETTYHYRIAATSQAGTDYGQDNTLTTGASTSVAQTPVPGDFFGMQWTGDFGQTSYPHVLSAVKNSGSRLLRLALYRGEDLQPKYEEIFRYASHRGITVIPYIGDGKWPLNSTIQDEWRQFAKKMVEKYGPGGSFWNGAGHPVIAWEVWNEPNLPTNSPISPNDPDNPYEKIGAELFGNFFHKMAEGLKEGAGGRRIEILTPGLFSFGASNCDNGQCHLSPANFLGQMDHTGDYDAVSLHPYVFKVKGTSSEPHAPTGPNQVAEVKEKVENYIRDVRQKLAGLGVGNKKVWVTELGFPVRNDAGNAGTFPPVTESVQQEEIESIFGMMKTKHDGLGLAHVFYYNIQDFRCSQWTVAVLPAVCAKEGDENPEWAYHTGLRKGPGGNRLSWRGFASVAPKGHPNWPPPKKATGTQTNRRALGAISNYNVETEGARYEARAEWGAGALSSSYPNATGWQVVEAQDEGEADYEPVNVAAASNISGLQPEMTYHYRIAVKDENGNVELEPTGHQFETKPLVTASVRTLNGEPGWVNVTGHVESETPLNNTWVNINFKKKEGGVYVPKPEQNTHAQLYNSDFSLVNWQTGRGEWQVNVVFEGNAQVPRGETGLESFTVKNAYHLVALNSGKCLEVSYGSSENGMSIHQEPCGDGHTQQAQAFTLVPSPYNPIQYQVINRKSGKCLDVNGASQADGAQILQYPCGGWGQTNQVFEGVPWSPTDSSHVKYIAQHSHKCFDITSASIADGALLEQWSCTGATNQAFGFESVEADPVPTNTYITLDETLNGHPGYETFHGSVEAPQAVAGQKVYVNFKKWNGSTYVFTSQAELTLNAAAQYSFAYYGVGSGDWEAIAIYPGSGNMAESRSPEGAHRFHVGDGYRFKFRHSERCLSTSGGGTSNGTALIQWDCSPTPNAYDGQVFSVVPMGGGYFEIQPDSNTGMCVDVTGANPANGAYLLLYQCLGAGQANQLWYFTPISGQAPWFAAIAKHSGRCMDVEGSKTGNGARVLQWDCAWTPNQQWLWQSIG